MVTSVLNEVIENIDGRGFSILAGCDDVEFQRLQEITDLLKQKSTLKVARYDA